jgi:hypothetical protein
MLAMKKPKRANLLSSFNSTVWPFSSSCGVPSLYSHLPGFTNVSKYLRSTLWLLPYSRESEKDFDEQKIWSAQTPFGLSMEALDSLYLKARIECSISITPAAKMA